MLQAGDQLDLSQKALGAEQRAELRPQHLDCHGAIVLEVATEVNRSHPAARDQTLERVPVRQILSKSRRYFARHPRSSRDDAIV
jgi:hypothetical protein